MDRNGDDIAGRSRDQLTVTLEVSRPEMTALRPQACQKIAHSGVALSMRDGRRICIDPRLCRPSRRDPLDVRAEYDAAFRGSAAPVGCLGRWTATGPKALESTERAAQARADGCTIFADQRDRRLRSACGGFFEAFASDNAGHRRLKGVRRRRARWKSPSRAEPAVCARWHAFARAKVSALLDRRWLQAAIRRAAR